MPARRSTPRALALVAALLASLLFAACFGGGGDDGDATPTASPTVEGSPGATETPSATATASPEPTRPPVDLDTVEARVTTNDLNVRTGPSVSYPAVGRLNEGDMVEVAGWRVDENGDRWRGIPGIGWVIDANSWIDFDRDAVDYSLDEDLAGQLAMVGPLHPETARTSNARVDEVIATVIEGDPGAIADLVTLVDLPCTTATGAGGPPKCPQGTSDGTPVTVFPFARCEGEYATSRQDAEDLAREWLAPFGSSGGPQALRVFAVVDNPLDGADDPFFGPVIIFGFPNAEGRAAFVSPAGGIGALAFGCGPTAAGEVSNLALLGATPPEELFFLLRPLAPPPLEAPRVQTWPEGTRTSDPLVDRVLDALEDGSREALAAVLSPAPLPCEDVPTSVSHIGKLVCLEDEAPGTIVDAIHVPYCEGGYLRPDSAIDRLVELVDYDPRLYMVAGDSNFERVDLPDRWFLVFQIATDFLGAQGPELVVDKTGVVAILWDCGLDRAYYYPSGNRLGLVTDPNELLLPPNTVSTEAPGVQTWPEGTRTGEPVVDRVLDAFEDGSREALAGVLHPEQMGCGTNPGYINSPPPCEEGETTGSLIDTIIVSQCEGGPARIEDALDRFVPFAADDQRLYAVYHLEESGWGPDLTFVLFDTYVEDAPVDRRFHASWIVLDQSGVTGFVRGVCSGPARNVVANDDPDEFILAPR